MNILGNVLYDPAVAVTKGAAASVLAAFDTVNARIAFVVPPSGMVRVVIEVTLHGAVTFSQIVLGCLEGATLRGRVVPMALLAGTALATTMAKQRVDYVVSGLAPGAALTWDAAWGIETFVAASLIKYGGPNNATANDAFGALLFQIWDPAPIYTPTSATAPTTTVQDKLVTEKTAVDGIKTKTDFLPSATAGAAGGLQIAGANAATTYATLTSTGAFTVNGVSAVSQTGDSFARLGAPAGASVSADVAAVKVDTAAVKAKTDNLPAAPASTTNISAGTITTVTNLTNAPTAGDLTATMKTSVTTACTASTPTAAAVTGNVGGNVTGSIGSLAAQAKLDVNAEADTALADVGVTAAVTGRIDAAVTSRAAAATALSTVQWTNGRATNLDSLDAAITSRLAAGSYTAPDNAGIASAAIDAGTLTGRLTAARAAKLDFLDAATSSRLASAAYIEPDNVSIVAIKDKTDRLTFTVPGYLSVDVKYVNGIQIIGTGATGSTWGPA